MISEEASPLRGEKHAGAGKAAALGSAVHAVFERITRWDDENKPEFTGKGFFKRLSDTAYIKYDAQKDEIEIAAGKVVLKDLNAD